MQNYIIILTLLFLFITACNFSVNEKERSNRTLSLEIGKKCFDYAEAYLYAKAFAPDNKVQTEKLLDLWYRKLL